MFIFCRSSPWGFSFCSLLASLHRLPRRKQVTCANRLVYFLLPLAPWGVSDVSGFVLYCFLFLFSVLGSGQDPPSPTRGEVPDVRARAHLWRGALAVIKRTSEANIHLHDLLLVWLPPPGHAFFPHAQDLSRIFPPRENNKKKHMAVTAPRYGRYRRESSSWAMGPRWSTCLSSNSARWYRGYFHGVFSCLLAGVRSRGGQGLGRMRTAFLLLVRMHPMV